MKKNIVHLTTPSVSGTSQYVGLLVLFLLSLPINTAWGTVLFSETFESYTPGSNLIGQGGWVAAYPGSIVTVNPGTSLSTQVMDGHANTGLGAENMAEHFVPIDPTLITTFTFDAFATLASNNQEVAIDTFGPSVNDRVAWYPSGTLELGWTFLPGGGNPIEFHLGGRNTPINLGIILDGVANEIYGTYDFGSGLIETAHYPASNARLSALNAVHIYVDHRAGSTPGIEADNFIVSVPEPTTLGLFGLGGIMMLRRKRKN